MLRMLFAIRAIFFQHQSVGRQRLILCRRIITMPTRGAFHLYNDTGHKNLYLCVYVLMSKHIKQLLNNFCNNSGADRAATFADRKTKLLLHRDR